MQRFLFFFCVVFSSLFVHHISSFGALERLCFIKVDFYEYQQHALSEAGFGRSIMYCTDIYRYITKAIYIYISKTCLYNFESLKPHFYIVKLGFTGVYIVFLLKSMDCGYSVEPPRQGGSNEYPQSIFGQNYEKYQNFLSENFNFFVGKFFLLYLNRRVFVMYNLFICLSC